MSRVGMWNGVGVGAAHIDADRRAQDDNYRRAAQRFNVLASFGIPTP